MTAPTIAFACLLHGTDPRLLDDVAAQVLPGDQVILVDTSGEAAALTRIQHRRWPAGVTLTPIVTDVAGTEGIATNLAFEAVITSHVVILSGLTRLTASLPRDLDDGLLCGPDPVLAQVILPRTALRRAEAAGRTDIAFLWTLRQAYPVRTTAPWAQTRPDPGPALLDAVTALLARDPAAAAWLRTSLPHWLSHPKPAARLILQSRVLPLKQSLKPAAPAQVARAKLRVRLQGFHANRTPLAYPHFAPLWADHVTLTEGAADLTVFAHPRDVITTTGNTLLLSEEPFWDSLFSPDPLADVITLPGGRLHQVNHHTSAIFAHDRIPYFVLTDPRYIRAYQRLFTRNAARSPADWQALFAKRSTDSVYMAENRPETFHDLTHPEGDIVGLCAWRTRLALAAPGRVARLGASWQGGATRFTLTDWHTDKLTQMDDHTRILSGLENTHQPAYLSEKLFDTFAVGARPLYYASPAHCIHALALPPGSWVNLYGLTSQQAAAALPMTEDAAFFADYAAAQTRLRDLFIDDTVTAERTRLGRAVIADLQRLADSGPA
ncbi:MAG: hypothetical protein KKB02_09175 [Alphaproteobacteria bacterium]|nr:hypothetical protein [Alphaproteobacteria bacterium]